MALSGQTTSVNTMGFPVDTDFMFSDHKGKYNKRIERRQISYAKTLPELNRFMDKDEKVLLIARGCSPMSFMEQYLTGWIIYYLKRAVFVFTNKRIFHLPVTSSYKYRNSIAEIRFADTESMGLRGGTLKVKYESGKTESFMYISSSERKKIKELLGNIPHEGAPSATLMRHHLCPRCTKPLEKDHYECPSCRLQFKNSAEGRMKSIIFPGGGYFYAGHPFLGLADAFVEVILILIVVISIIDLVNGVPESGVVLIFYGIIFVLEKIISVYHSSHFLKEYIPKDRTISPVSGI
ncbi:MAG: hypothetical protein HW386_1264 [Gammaproteobacteria bacterium]|nr:hypothetical protein [Gammaproteobacteria bacterium]